METDSSTKLSLDIAILSKAQKVLIIANLDFTQNRAQG